MSQINTSVIDETFPVQGQDNPSQGFRDNFNAIKSALNVAKQEITTLENNTAKNNANNNFNGKIIENAVANNIHHLYKNKGNTSGQILINVRECQYVKIGATGNINIRLTNWPQTEGSIFKAHKIILHLKFAIPQEDTDPLNRRIYFSTDGQGVIRSYTTGAPWFYNNTLGGWHLKPYTNTDVSTNINDYEHVIEAWSYNEGNEVFLDYKGSYR